MVTGSSGTRVQPVLRRFWLCAVVLMLFMQLALASEPCRDLTPCGQGAQHAGYVAGNGLHGERSAPCADIYVVASQLPAIDSALLAPAMGPATVVAALWQPWAQAPAPQPRSDAEPFVSVPRFLAFGRLLR